MLSFTPKLLIVTSVIRVENLPTLDSNIRSVLEGVNYQWYCVIDKAVVNPAPSIHAHVEIGTSNSRTYGFSEKNQALDVIKEDGFVMFLDDDTLLPTVFKELFVRYTNDYPEAGGFVFGQQHPNKVLLTPPGLTQYVNYIDVGQYILKRKLIGTTRFGEEFGSDGYFFTDCYTKNPNDIVFSSEVGFLWNYLRWDYLKDNEYAKPY